MKKIIALTLLAVMLLSLAACGTVNKTEVSVLWTDLEYDSEGRLVMAPNGLMNAMDRAMYIENISYAHYDADADQATQTKQATECLDKGASALLVELVDAAAAQEIVDLAKAKNVPVVFFGTNVDAAVVESYGKCAAVCIDPETLGTTYFKMVSEYVLDNVKLTKEGKKPAKDDMDLDNDGKVSYITVGEIALTETTAYELDKNEEPKLNKDGSYAKAVELVSLAATFEELEVAETTEEGSFGSTTTYRQLKTPAGETVEMILVADDLQAMDTFLALQEKGLNTNQLSTCFVPVFTVGVEADYKAYVMASLPTEAEARKTYLEEMMLVADMTGLSAEEWDNWAAGQENQVDTMIFNTFNQVDTGRLSGTAVEDYDALAEAAAELTAQLLKGNPVEEAVVKVEYTTYTG